MLLILELYSCFCFKIKKLISRFFHSSVNQKLLFKHDLFSFYPPKKKKEQSDLSVTLFLCSVCFRVPRSQKWCWWVQGHRNRKKWLQNDWNEAKGLLFVFFFLTKKRYPRSIWQNTCFKDHIHCHIPAASTKCKDCRRSKIVEKKKKKKILLPQCWRQAARTANTNYPQVLPLYPSSGKTQSPPTE